MRVIVFGATGMVGQGVVQECLEDDAVTDVLVVGRRPCGAKHEKLREHLQPDPSTLGALEGELGGSPRASTVSASRRPG